jgi:hypothetical protein
MPQITERKNKRLFIEQSILNKFPSDMKARWFKYSVAAQAIHPFGAAIHELSVAQERVWHNYFPATYDVTDIDLIYHVPSLFTDVEIDAYLDDVTSVNLVKTEPDLDSFWYDPLPTRLSFLGTSQKQIYPTREASKLRFGAEYDWYTAGTHLESDLFNSSTNTPWSVVSGVASIPYSTGSGWGGGAYLGFQYTDAPTATTVTEATSTATCTGEQIAFFSQYLDAGQSPVTSMIVTVGYQGVGSAQGTFVPDQQWQQQAVVYTPPTSTSTGIPFVNISAVKGIGDTAELQLSDFHLFKYGSIHSDTNSAYPLRDWADQDLSWAYVIVTGGTNLMDVDTSMTRPSLPASVTIEGVDGNGRYSTERVVIPHNGTHRSLKLWKQITGTRVDSMYPWTANVSVQLQNYQSFGGQQDPVDGYISPYHDGPLFYSLLSTNGSSFLGHDSFIVDDFAQMVDGYDFILPRYYMELTDINSQSFTLQDIKIDVANRHLYALDAENSLVLMYDPFGHWPDQSAFKTMKDNVSPYPDMVIRELDEDEQILVKDSSLMLEANWRNRYKELLQNRWTIHKPDGTIVGLDENGNEVSPTSNYWIVNEESTDKITGEFRFKPQQIQYTATGYGDYVAVLETQYVDSERTDLIQEKDSTIFSVVNRSPMKSLTIPSTDGRTPIGMDLDPNGNIRIAYTNPDNSSLLDEEVFGIHYDYFFEEVESKRIYLREKYTKVKIRRIIDVACATAKKVTVVSNTDTVLSSADTCNGFILVLTDINPVQITMPPVGAAEEGHHCIIKRRGANAVTIVPDAGDTVENAASLPVSIDGDSKNLTYVDSIKDWVLS